MVCRLLPEVLADGEDMSGYFSSSFCGGLQHKLWNLLENPNSSLAAKVSLFSPGKNVLCKASHWVHNETHQITHKLGIFLSLNASLLKLQRGEGGDHKEWWCISIKRWCWGLLNFYIIKDPLGNYNTTWELKWRTFKHWVVLIIIFFIGTCPFVFLFVCLFEICDFFLFPLLIQNFPFFFLVEYFFSVFSLFFVGLSTIG